MYLKDLAATIPSYCTLLVHGRGKGYHLNPRQAAEDQELAHRIVAIVIPIDAYKAEIIVEGD